MGRLVRVLPAAIALVALSGLSGCGSNDKTATDPADATDTASTSPTATETTTAVPTTSPASDLPDCATTWVSRAQLPSTYKGCVQDGAEIPPKKHACSFGSSIIEFDNQFYAVAGSVINQVPDLATSAQFHRALTACQA